MSGLEEHALKELLGRVPGTRGEEDGRGELQPAGRRSKEATAEWWSRSGRVRKR